jgi:hypothetical protein
MWYASVGTHFPKRTLAWGIALAIVVIVLADGVRWIANRHDGPALPYRGAAAAAFLSRQPGGNDAIVGARCTRNLCTVRLHPIPRSARVPTARLYQDLAVDVVFIGGLGQPNGAVATPTWRFTLATRTGVLTATCTNAEAHRVGGTITPGLLPSICPTTWRPHSS